MSDTITVTTRPLAGADERNAAARLYRRVFGLSDSEPAMTAKLLAALQHHGGSAVGAFDDDGVLVGFTYGFVGLDQRRAYHHSQAAVVDPRVQGTGVGRALKHAQARLAAATGVQSMRWAYDPMQARNAHFNLDVLGARGRWFRRDYYGMDDELGRTDRVLVDWPLRSSAPHCPAAPALPPRLPGWADVTCAGAVAWLSIPAHWTQLARDDPGRAAALRDRVAGRLERLLVDGRALLSCLLATEDTAVYRIGADRVGTDRVGGPTA